MKKKVLIFHPIIPPYRVDFFNAIVSRFHSEIYLFWRNLRDQTFDYEKIRSDFKFDEKYLVREEIGWISWITGIWRLLKDFRPNVVIGAEFGISTIAIILYKWLTFRRYKIIIMCDDSYDMIANHNQFSFRHTMAKKLLMPFIDDLIVPDSRVAEYYQKRCRKGKWFPIIYNDIHMREKYQSLLPLSNEYISKYGLDGKKILLFVGRLVALKNMAFTLKCFLKMNVPDSVFVIIGDGPERRHLEQIASKSPNVIFTGRLEGDDLYAWYNVAQCFTLPSTQEAFGAVVGEALVAGCTCLVSQRAGSNCLIQDGLNGYVFNPLCEQELIAGMEKVFLTVDPICRPLRVRECSLLTSFRDCMGSLVNGI